MYRFALAEQVVEAGEYARALPFMSIIMVWLAWILISELLLGSGALEGPHDEWSHYTVSSIVVLSALAAPHTPQAYTDLAALSVWLALLFPSHNIHRLAPLAASLGRVALLCSLYWLLEWLGLGNKIRPAKGYDAYTGEVQTVLVHATHVAALAVAQTGWILIVPSLWLAGAPLLLVNQYISQQRTGPRKLGTNLSPPVSRTPSPSLDLEAPLPPVPMTADDMYLPDMELYSAGQRTGFYTGVIKK